MQNNAEAVARPAESGTEGSRDCCGTFDLDAVERYIARNCADVTLEDVGARFSCHPNSITRALRRGRGVSFQGVLREARAQKACDLLSAGATVEEAAAKCGYDNLGHFYRMFRTARGVTPGAYRRQELDARAER